MDAEDQYLMEPSKGSIPKDIEGTFFRNGPGKFKVRYKNIKLQYRHASRHFRRQGTYSTYVNTLFFRATNALERPISGEHTRRAVPSWLHTIVVGCGSG